MIDAAILSMALSLSQKSCNEQWTGFVGPPPNASVAWDHNSCNHQLRVKIHCENPVSHFSVNEYGGWVKRVGLHSGQTCPANENHLLAAYGQYRNRPGAHITTVRFF